MKISSLSKNDERGWFQARAIRRRRMTSFFGHCHFRSPRALSGPQRALTLSSTIALSHPDLNARISKNLSAQGLDAREIVEVARIRAGIIRAMNAVWVLRVRMGRGSASSFWGMRA